MSTSEPAELPEGVSVEALNAFLDRDFPGGAGRVAELGSGWALVRSDIRDTDLRPGEIISGPSVFATADMALWCALFTVCGFEPMALTSELSIRFLRPARGSTVFGRAVVQHAGRRSVIGSITMWTDNPDKPVAVAQGTYVRPQG
jgi:acyl-coenzyme A thioesterase PaaI-like protein